MQKLWIYGAGGHGAVVANIAIQTNSFELAGFWDDDEAKKGKTYCGYPIMGGFENIPDVNDKIWNAIFIAIGDNETRKSLAGALTDSFFPRIVAPSAVIETNTEIGDGTIIMPGAVIEPFAKIGRHCIVNNHAVIGHDVVVEDFCHVSGGAIVCGQCIVGRGTLIGINASIIPTIHIGRYCHIAAGSVVTKNCADNSFVMGNPARVLSHYFSPPKYPLPVMWHHSHEH